MLITVKNSADLLGCNPETIRRWCREGVVRARKPGKTWLVEQADILSHCLFQRSDDDTTATRVKKLRQLNKRTITETAWDIEVDPGTYSMYEKGRKRIPSKVIVKLALYYNVTTDYLLCMDLYRREDSK